MKGLWAGECIVAPTFLTFVATINARARSKMKAMERTPRKGKGATARTGPAGADTETKRSRQDYLSMISGQAAESRTPGKSRTPRKQGGIRRPHARMVHGSRGLYPES